MTIEHYIIAKLAECMSELGETQQEREAIGCMVRNLISKHGSDWFTEISTACLRFIDAPSNPHDPKFIKTLWAAEEIFYNRMADPTDGATQYSKTPVAVNCVRIGRFYFTGRDSA